MKIRKAILTGGGTGSRLQPLTYSTNKHLIPLANKPIIYHAIEKMVEAGITDIFININENDKSLKDFIGDGGHWGINITLFTQIGGPLGIANVVKQAEKFIGDDAFAFYLSDNIFAGSLKPVFEKFEKEKLDCILALSEVPDPERFGVPYFDENKKLIDVKEKPANPPNNFAVTGFYIYGPKIFFKAYENIEKSLRGEYEISDIHSYFLKNNYNVGYEEITGYWKDTGKIDDLLLANRLILDKMNDLEFAKFTNIPNLKAKIHLGRNVKIGDGVELIEPVMIGDGVELINCKIGPYTTIYNNTSVKNAEIKNSIILENSTIHWDTLIDGGLIGKNVVLKNDNSGKNFIIGDKTKIEI
jgi:glucose-1-phosphate thymidylyltransferase